MKVMFWKLQSLTSLAGISERLFFLVFGSSEHHLWQHSCRGSACVRMQDFFSFALIAALLYLVASAYYQLEKIK